MKRINRCNEVVKLLSAARCCAKAIVDVAAEEFRFSVVEFIEKFLFDEVDKKVSITRSHFSVHSDSVNLLVIVIRERKAVKRENDFSEANKRFGASLFVSALIKNNLSARSPSWLGITVYNEVMSIVKISLSWPGKLKSRNVLSKTLGKDCCQLIRMVETTW